MTNQSSPAKRQHWTRRSRKRRVPSCHHAKRAATAPRCTRRSLASSTTRTHTGKQAARRQACTKAYTKTAIRLPARKKPSIIMPNTPQIRCNSVHAATHIAKRQADTRPTPDSPTASKHAAKQHVHNTLSMQHAYDSSRCTHAARLQQAQRQQYENGKPDNKQSCSKSDEREIWDGTNDNDDG